MQFGHFGGCHLHKVSVKHKLYLHVHLVRSWFGLFLWKAAQHDGSYGPLKDKKKQTYRVKIPCYTTLILYVTINLCTELMFKWPS